MIEVLPNGEIRFNLFPKQAQFINSEIDDILYGGAVGGGKSASLLAFSAIRRLRFPKSMGIIFRRTFRELEGSLIIESQKIYPKMGAKYNENKKQWKFPNGSIQAFGYCESDGDAYHHMCFHPDTEILTKDGWIFVKDAKVGQLAATLNPKTRHMEYKTITATPSFDFDGEMIELFQRKGVSFSVTPNHKIWVSGERRKSLLPVEAKDLPMSCKIPQWANWKGRKPKNKFSFTSIGNNGRTISFDSKSWFSFMGWYLSEGSTEKKGTVKISQIKPCGREKIISLLEGCSINVYKSKDALIFCNLKLRNYLHKFGYCYDKYIPREMLDANREHLLLLLNSLIDGDGSWYNNKRRGVFVTSSNRLKDGVMELAIKCGYTAVCKQYRGYFADGRTKVWQVSVAVKKTDTAIRSSSGKKTLLPKKVPYKGKVYCVTVPPHHTVLIRYKGRISWSGQTAQYNDVCFDELTHFSKFQYAFLTSRCRSTIPGCRPLIRSASNPGNVGHHWVFMRYIKPYATSPQWTDPETKKTLAFVPARIDDNPALMESDPGYIDRLRELPEKKYLALAEGRWDVFEGVYFSEWTGKVGFNILPFVRVPDSYTKKIICLDWGFADPACVLWLEVTPMGRVFVYRELYQTKLAPKELATKILEMSPEGERYDYLVASPEIWGKKVETEGGGETIHDLMQSTLGDRIVMQKANNARVPGWLKIREYLMPAPDGMPWMQISPVCLNLIQEIPGLIHEDKDGKSSEDIDAKCSDHCSESLRYGIVSLRDIDRAPITPHMNNYEKIFGRQNQGNPNMAAIPMPGRSGYGR